ncbi:unnamed protein product [Bemisia tabaci]|uniref:Epoxide hydrolase n=1 Tax=Bemisia tabaci TaxID=7038 RepID=A0A9P0AB52_BEMTA|nr:unnamed protein product [Bemisia tabaci]
MFFKAILGVLLAIVGYFLFIGIKSVLYPADVVAATLSENAWWGARRPESIIDDKIHPFTITTSASDLEYLRSRLKNTKFPHAPLKEVNFQYGFNLDYLKLIRSHWLNNYDWNARLKFLNSLPHFKTTVSGLNVHFIHAKPSLSSTASLKVIPILVIHGWPGSVREFYDLIPKLVTPRKSVDFVFEVVAPSLPGYGFSEASAIQGMATAQMGVIFKKLMQKLGHETFYIHGGDWGSLIGRDMSIAYPQNVLGFHSTMCASSDAVTLAGIMLGSYYPELVVEKEDEPRLYPVSKFLHWLYMETGYMHIQATKPDTVGTALLDSPIGLAAYILEKFSSWTNEAYRNLPDGGLTKKFTLDALLDNVMIYWTTDSILTSMRLYSEYFSTNYKKLKFDAAPVKVPTVCAQFPHELVYSPPFGLQRKYKKLVKISKFNDGGHFAAFELPDFVANDIWASIPLFIEAHQNATSSLNK